MVDGVETWPGDPSALVGAEEIAARVTELAEVVTSWCVGSRPLLVGVLTGAYVFLADLSRQLRVRHDIAFIRAGSYGDSATPAAEVTVQGVREAGVAGRQVVVVEDVVDTGHTLAVVVTAMHEAGAASVRSCVLAVKDRPSRYPIEPDLVGFRVPDVFLVGYGIDYQGAWRHLPYLGFVVPAED